MEQKRLNLLHEILQAAAKAEYLKKALKDKEKALESGLLTYIGKEAYVNSAVAEWVRHAAVWADAICKEKIKY